MQVIKCFEVMGHTDTTEGRGPMTVAARFSTREIIKQLAKQAGMIEYPTGLGISENTIWGDRNIERFAELIVRECAKMCLVNDPGDATYIGQQAAEKYVKQRFGVE